MTPFLLILGAYALLSLPGLRRLPGDPRRADRAAVAMGVVMVLPAVMHFTRTERFVAMIPPQLPSPATLVYLSGAAELLLAVLLLIPATRRAAGWFGVVLLLAVWPANIYVASSGNYPAGLSQSALYHWVRVPFQVLYVGWASWIALGHPPGREFRRRMMAKYYDRMQRRYERWTEDRRRALFEDLQGSVLELGPGTGVNFKYFPRHIAWLGVEPNPHMHGQLRQRATELGFEQVEFRGLAAEQMDQASESVDAVVSTLVLCSLEHPERVIADVLRVLKPGGSFYFMEHVAAPRGSGRRRLQRVLRGFWQFIADGCTLDRETGDAIRAGGFERVEFEEFEAPRNIAPSWVAPHIIGKAIKRTADAPRADPVYNAAP